MESQIESISVDPPAAQRLCGVEGCREPAAAKVDMREFCLSHFLSAAFVDLRTTHEHLRNGVYDSTAMASFRETSSIWAREAERILEEGRFGDLEKKSRLSEGLRWISQAGRSLRRSPRESKAFPVWLRREDPRRTWEEDTWTTTVSRHGASFTCRHPVETGGIVILTRKDKGGRVQARVVYSRLDSEGRREIGVELLDRDDFWD